MKHRNLIVAVTLGSFLSDAAAQQPFFESKVRAEKKVAELPNAPLFWRIEIFPSLAEAQAASSQHSLITEALGKVWLFTLGPQGQATKGATTVAEVGPLAKVDAAEHLLRVNEGHGAPGGTTAVHTHPGSEAFYVVEGEISQKTPHGVDRVKAGQSLAGHGADAPMQVSISGASSAAWFALFVLDANKPVTSPAKFD
jgi:quercetin dioxygenase-like cupin family protein